MAPLDLGGIHHEMIKKSHLINFSGFLFTCMLCLLVLETYARFFLKINYFTLDKNQQGIESAIDEKIMIYDEVLGLRPGPEWGRMYENGISNEIEYLDDAGPDTKNIVLLGDSIIQTELMKKCLEYLLRGRKYKILNAGVGYYNTAQEVFYFRNYVKVPTHILILGFCLNDFMPSTIIVSDRFNRRKAVRQLFEPLAYVNPFLFRRSALYRYLKSNNIRTPSGKGMWSADTILRNRVVVKRSLEVLHKYCAWNGIPLVVVIFPHLLEYSCEPVDWLCQAHASIIEILNELSIKYIDLHDEYRRFGHKNLRLAADDGVHPNSLGNFIASWQVIDKFHLDLGLTEYDKDIILSVTYDDYEKGNPHN